MGAVAMKRVLAVALMLVLLAAGAWPAGAKGSRHEPPYKKGPSGGDEFNHIEADPQTGQIDILRIFPGIPPVVGCVPQADAGWAMFHMPHKVTGNVESVVAKFDAMLDPYSWVTVGARAADGEWLGVKKFQGPFSGTASIKARLHHHPKPGDEITLEFGLQLGDACPQVGGGSVTFSWVSVN
jgi:hypothetical protein